MPPRDGRPPPARRPLTPALACTLAVAMLAGCAAGRATGPMGAAVSAPYRGPAGLAPGEILHAATGRVLDARELLDHLAHVRVVYVGERHDSAADHRVQLAIIEGLAERGGGPLLLGLEMLQQPYQAQADAFIRGEIDEAAFRRTWEGSWGSWEPYAEILGFARGRGIALLALGADPRLTEAVRGGLTALPPEVADRLPEMDLDDAYHRAYVAAIFAGHGHGATDFERFYRVQVLWDEAMAEAGARGLARRDQPARLVVLAGAGHVRFGFGIPRRLFRRLPVPYATVLPVPVGAAGTGRPRTMDVSPPALPLPEADFYWAVRDE